MKHAYTVEEKIISIAFIIVLYMVQICIDKRHSICYYKYIWIVDEGTSKSTNEGTVLFCLIGERVFKPCEKSIYLEIKYNLNIKF